MNEWIEKSWVMRWTDDFDGARAVYSRLQNENVTEAERAELDLLQASFLRRQLRNAEAKEWIEKARGRILACGRSETFQLLMQSALCLEVDSRFADSHLLYLRAMRLAANETERIMAKFNLIATRFNLGLETDSLIAEFIKDFRNDHPLRNLFQKIHVMRTEKLFFNGEFEKIVNDTSDLSSQALYQRAWFESLPWLEEFKNGALRNTKIWH
jgi:hypothetical protein